VETLLNLFAGILVVGLITAATGYFVAQEFSYMAVDRSALRARADAGDPGAERALRVTRRTSFMLSGAQLGITVTALLVGYVAEPLIGQSLGKILGGISIPTGVAIGIGAVIALIFSTIVQMIFGELFPKNLSIARSEPVAIALSRSTRIYLATFGWLIAFFDASSNALLRLFRIEPVHDVEHSASARDLEHIVEESRDSGHIPDELFALLDRILDFPDQNVRHAMVPRTKADTVSVNESIADVRQLMSHGHSRYPVLASNGEDVLGVVHLLDLLTHDHNEHESVRTIMRPALLVSTVMSLPEALEALIASDNQIACVVDEYGGFTGVLSVEDLAEEIVGEITDEHDSPEVTHHHDGAGWVMSGDTHLDEVERAINETLPEGKYETIAGLAVSAKGGFPVVGEIVWVELPVAPDDLISSKAIPRRRLGIEALEIERHVPSLVRVMVERGELS
jgi:CBS domain containing-hemolysin-like protein